MPQYTFIDANIPDYSGGSPVFCQSKKGLSADSLGKRTPAQDKIRQQHFQSQLITMARILGSNSIPIFLNIRGRKCRLDKGCVGHAVAGGFLRQPVNGHEGIVGAVTLSNG